MKRIDKFLNRLFRNQHSSQEYFSQIQEMLYEKVDDLVEKGYSEEDAVNKTIDEFGDVDDFYFSNIERPYEYKQLRKTLLYYRNMLRFSIIATIILTIIYFIVNHMWVFKPSFPWLAIVLTLATLIWPIGLYFKFKSVKATGK